MTNRPSHTSTREHYEDSDPQGADHFHPSPYKPDNKNRERFDLPVSRRPKLLLPFERVGREREEEPRDGVRMGVEVDDR
jgi:hypothetical protein